MKLEVIRNGKKFEEIFSKIDDGKTTNKAYSYVPELKRVKYKNNDRTVKNKST